MVEKVGACDDGVRCDGCCPDTDKGSAAASERVPTTRLVRGAVPHRELLLVLEKEAVVVG